MTADELRAEADMPMRPITKGRMLKEAAAEIERLTAENERLRAALREIDRVAVAHVAGGIGIAQRVARNALNQQNALRSGDDREAK